MRNQGKAYNFVGQKLEKKNNFRVTGIKSNECKINHLGNWVVQ